MAKIPYNDFLKSISMFFLDEKVDKKYIAERNDFSNLAYEMREINHRQGLENYIRECPDSIDNLLIILGVSGEYFKRITSLFRRLSGLEFRTEWSISTYRNYIISNNDMMYQTLNLFLEADDNEDLSKYIPKYRLANFKITPAVMGRLSNPDFLKLLFSKELDTSFNNAMTRSKVAQIESILQSICRSKGYSITRAYNIDVNGNNTRNIPVNYVISKPNKGLPSYYINYSLYLTTSKGQTSIKNNVKNLRDYIINDNPDAIQINIIDGAGWVARQGDLLDIWDYSNYCLTLSLIEQLKDIII